MAVEIVPSGRVALITGASAGLGAAIVRKLAQQGKAVALVLVARRSDRLDALADEVRTIAPEIETLAIPCDLADLESAEMVVARTIDAFGRINLLVNNAGLGLPTLFADADPELLRRQVAVNFTAPLLLTRHALPHLASSRGLIINIGSAISTIPNSALGAYGATKAGLAYWNDALRRELCSQGVRICLVEPGPIRTEFSAAFGKLANEEAQPHPVVETPSAWMTADVTDVAGRIVALIDRPRRRLSVLRRLVWPMRAFGAVLRLWPALGDAVVADWFKVEHAGPLAEGPSK